MQLLQCDRPHRDGLQLVDPSPDLGFPLPPESYSQVKKEGFEPTQPTPTAPTQSHTFEPETYISDGFEESDYGLLPPDYSVIIRPYGDDSDDMMLSELRPRWIIMYEPNLDFIRRVEVCNRQYTYPVILILLIVLGIQEFVSWIGSQALSYDPPGNERGAQIPYWNTEGEGRIYTIDR